MSHGTEAPDVALRRASAVDEGALLRWRNDPATRRASFTQDEIDPEEHHRWFQAGLADPAAVLLLVEHGGRDAGLVRLTKGANDVVEIHIVLAPWARGLGLAKPALREGRKRAASALGADSVIARVKPGNEASLRAFRAAGFTEVGREPHAVELRAPAA